MTTAERGATVRFPFPPALFLLPLAAALAVHFWVLPWHIPARPMTAVVGVMITALGVVISFSGVVTVLRHRTTVVPHHPVSTLVTTGPYRFTRNPMYVGHAVALVGVGLWAGSWWPIVATPLCMLATRQLVIDAEEEYLTRRFGAEYQRYRARVRRWL